MFIKRIKDMFNLNKPMGRLRYFVTYLIVGIIICPILLTLTPNIILYDGETTLLQAIIDGTFEKTEVIMYIILSSSMCYAVEFFLDAKRILDILDDKKTAILFSSLITILGIVCEFFVPLNSESISISDLYLFFEFGLFGFLCLKPGKLFTDANTEENNPTEENKIKD